MKRSIILLILTLFMCGQGNTAVRYLYRWKNSNITLTLIDDYGNSLKEKIRARNQREKAHHIFNLLANTDISTEINIILSENGDIPRLEGQKVYSLDIEEIEKAVDLKIVREEIINPHFYDEKLICLKKRGDAVELDHNGLSILNSKEAFSFFGKQRDIILVAFNGKLKYLSGADWIDLEHFEGYSVSNMLKWVDEKTVAAYVERDSDGEKFIAVAGIFKPEIALVPAPEGTIIDFEVTAGEKIYVFHFAEEGWRLSEYIRSGREWVVREEFDRRVDFMGIRKNKPVFWDKGNKQIIVSGGTEFKVVDYLIVETHPEGRYISGQGNGSLVSAASVSKTVLFYDKKQKEKLIRMGIGKIDKFYGNPEVWVLPANYKSDIYSLPGDIGNIFLSAENMRIYYDTLRQNLRHIESVRLKPTFKERNIIVFLSVLLLVLLVNDLSKKAKEYSK